MNSELQNIDEQELLDKDEQAISKMVAGLKHVQAPVNFERRVMTKVSEGPLVRRSIFAIPVVAYGVPLALVLVLATFFVFKFRQPSSAQPSVVRSVPPAAEQQVERTAREPVEPALPVENNSSVALVPGVDKVVRENDRIPQRSNSATRQRGGGSYTEGLTPKKAPLPSGIQVDPQTNSNRGEVISAEPIPVKDLLSTLGMNVEYQQGWKVSSVSKNSIANRAGITSGDEILSLGEKDLTADTNFQGAGSINSIRYRRNGVVRSVKIN